MAGVRRSPRIVFDGRLPAVPVENAMRDEPVRRVLGLDLIGGLPERQAFDLREDVREQHVVMTAEGVQRLDERDEVGQGTSRVPGWINW